MFIVRRKDLKKDGNNRTLLYGYGGFQHLQTSEFTASIYPWLERGGVYAVAEPARRRRIRRGVAQGRDEGRRSRTCSTTSSRPPSTCSARATRGPRSSRSRGGSNGGLLVGAAMTQKPEYFAAVLCSVPLLDMVRYHLFGSGKTWISEYGSAEDEADFKALYAYSPYHHINENAKYPALLMLSADSDDRVDPMHARKFAAAMQERSTGGPDPPAHREEQRSRGRRPDQGRGGEGRRPVRVRAPPHGGAAATK
jgi:prolyl oligopeptidase